MDPRPSQRVRRGVGVRGGWSARETARAPGCRHPAGHTGRRAIPGRGARVPVAVAVAVARRR
eukprot:3759-Pelagococcus_subviridis.AAC.1